MKRPRLFIGPMSVNIVDAIIEFANETGEPLGLIPSRRQVDSNGGYVGWTTESFTTYVRNRSRLILLQRDHGGEGQGDKADDGVESYTADAKYFDLVHIDPWKAKKDYAAGFGATLETIQLLDRLNPNVGYEVGTEEAIHPTTPSELDQLIGDLKKALPAKVFARIAYGVIQSGTSLRESHNTGTYSEDRLEQMVAVCKKHNLLSKEHNGDYLETALIKAKFAAGLDAINIAPEFGKIETETAMEMLGKSEFDVFFTLCVESGRWKKWVAADFDPNENREALVRICGHYVFAHPKFAAMRKALPGFDAEAKRRIKHRIREIVQ